MMARIVFENVTKRFGSNTAIKDLNMEVGDGSFVSLLGEPGAGKTTLLRMISGLEVPTSGNIYIDDVRVNKLSPAERDVAMVFQSFALYPHYTVYKNLAFPLKKKKMSSDDIDRRVKEVAEVLDISNLLQSYPGTLSGGERQRVAMGRAMVRSPKVLLMDEPLSNLDARLRINMRLELKRLQQELNQTLILTTADELEAMTMGDKIAVIDRGVLQQYEAPDTLYNNPANPFIASFVGSPPMNMMEGILEKNNGRRIMNLGMITVDMSNFDLEQYDSGAEFILGIRPPDISLHDDDIEGGFEAEVYITEPTGDRTIVTFSLGDQFIRTLVSRRKKIEKGDRVWMVFDKDRIHLFEKGTEKRIER